MNRLLNFIDQLRARPEGERKRWLLGSSFGITAVIALLWLSQLTLTFGAPSAATQIASIATTRVSSEVGIFARIKNGYQVLKESLNHAF